MRTQWVLSDRHRDVASLILVAGLCGTTLFLVSLTQSYFLVDQTTTSANLQGSLLSRMIASLIPVWAGALALGLANGTRKRQRGEGLLVCLLVAVGSSVARAALQRVLKVYRDMTAEVVVIELAAGLLAGAMCCLLAYSWVSYVRRLRETYLSAARAHERTAHAIDALRAEEVRVHQVVSEGLHGNLQQRFVLLEAWVDHLVNEVGAKADYTALLPGLESLKRELVATREDSVRATSRLLSPDGLDVGLVGAVRILLGRLPSHIRYSLDVDEQARIWDDPEHPRFTQNQRLIAVRFAQEAVTNALKHGMARGIDISISVSSGQGSQSDRALQLIVRNDGDGLAGGLRTGSGLDRLRRRLELANGRLALVEQEGGGVAVEMFLTLPVESE